MKRKIFLMAVVLPCLLFAVVTTFAFKSNPVSEKKEEVAADKTFDLVIEERCFGDPYERDAEYEASLEAKRETVLLMDWETYYMHSPGGGVYCYRIEYYP